MKHKKTKECIKIHRCSTCKDMWYTPEYCTQCQKDYCFWEDRQCTMCAHKKLDADEFPCVVCSELKDKPYFKEV